MTETKFRASTVAQFKIGIWLDEMGIEVEDIAAMEAVALDTVKVTNMVGQWMLVRWADDHAEILDGDPGG